MEPEGHVSLSREKVAAWVGQTAKGRGGWAGAGSPGTTRCWDLAWRWGVGVGLGEQVRQGFRYVGPPAPPPSCPVASSEHLTGSLSQANLLMGAQARREAFLLLEKSVKLINQRQKY